jgi:MYXO-CTERM domain-containing protein
MRLARIGTIGAGVGSLLLVGLASRPAAAETVCGTALDFNAAMAATGGYVEEVTVTFDVVGVNPADFHNDKGCLGQLRFTGCGLGGQEAAIKVYGTSEPLNEAHPPGTLKQEYGNACCAGGCGEGWADPNPSAVIFVDGSEACHVTMWMDPLTFGYSLDCGGVVYDAVGDNEHANPVDHIALLEYYLADGGTTWEMPNAIATNDEACWVTVPTGMDTMTVPVVQDVTAGPSEPDTVFADVTDLAVEAAANEAYLQFDVPAIEGKVTEATLYLHTRPESFAEGDGGEVHVVTSHDWSEASLTWNTRPSIDAASLGRIGPAAADVWVSLDVTAAIAGPGTHGFAVISPATDSNGTHFMSKEGSADLAPYVLLKYVVVDVDGDGTPDGPDCDDADPAVGPDAAESCNGVDDDCDGELDEGCPGAEGDDGTASGADTEGGGTSQGGDAGDGTAGGGVSFGLDRGGGAEGCACATGRDRSGPISAWLGVLWLATARRRRSMSCARPGA